MQFLMKYAKTFLIHTAVLCAAAGCNSAKKENHHGMEEKKSFKEITSSSLKRLGLFDFYQDTASGALYMVVKQEQLNKEYIHFLHFTDAVLEASAFRGAFSDTRVFSISKNFNKVVFTLHNAGYYFDPSSPLSKASKANINEPVLFVKEIATKDSAGNMIFEAGDLFLTEALMQIKPSPDPDEKEKKKKRFELGELSKEKSQTVGIKNYPENTDILVNLVYESKYPVVRGSEAVTDARFVSIGIQHSIIRMPENDYQPRLDDPRVGYFTQQINDMTSTAAANYRDLINRWHLVKKDKSAELSEPVQPITWWIENTTPRELRAAVKAGVLEWNKAFESAGFKNAIEVKEQPDDADWDAGDIRYNVLRWTSSPQPPFGGYGPSFVNPRTGQILGADIMLEYVFVTNRLRYEKLFDVAGLDIMKEEHFAHEENFCSFGSYHHANFLFGMAALNALSVPDAEKDEFLKQSLYMLTLHEVGHTLGLSHNMKASHMNSIDEMNDKARGETVGLTGSVMDYSNPNISKDRARQGLYFDIIPGPYDHWAIQYGYMEANDEQLNKLLARSTEKALWFGNDADDMRDAGKHIDPRVMIGDMSDDPMAFAEERILLVREIYPKLIKKYSEENKSYHELRTAYLILTGQHWNSVRVISRQIGGVKIDRAFAGQHGATVPFIPLDYKTQKKAMALLARYAFAPGAFDYPAEINNYLQMQRRGFSNYDINEDPKLHERFLIIQKDVLDHLLHENVLLRMNDSRLYGNKYPLSEMMSDLTNAIFADDLKTGVNTIRQNLQTEYTGRLAEIIDPESKYDHLSRSATFAELQKIKSMMKNAAAPNSETKAHRQYVAFIIDRALETE